MIQFWGKGGRSPIKKEEPRHAGAGLCLQHGHDRAAGFAFAGFTNNDKANEFLKPYYREGWELPEISV